MTLPLLRSLAGVAALSLSCTAAFAADATKERGQLAEACAADLKTLCPGVKPGEGRLKSCMRDNREKLSEACREAMKEQRGKRKGAGEKS
ncbi:MAG TPA: cysteine rich repeat-containing protein [Rubrivivax sp.]|jgi:hypothetical protein|nr:cysteine rich repeat-containing protein [Rubrivivax sp.]